MPVARAELSKKSCHRWCAWAEIPQHFCQQNSLHIVRASSRRCVAQRSNCADRTASFRWSSVNSGEKPAGFYEELTQKTEPKFVKTSSVFLETDDIFCACFAITHLQKQGTAASEPSNNLRFLIKKSGERAAGNAWKNWKHISYLTQILSASELSEARIALPFFQWNCRTQQRRRSFVIA